MAKHGSAFFQIPFSQTASSSRCCFLSYPMWHFILHLCPSSEHVAFECLRFNFGQSLLEEWSCVWSTHCWVFLSKYWFCPHCVCTGCRSPTAAIDRYELVNSIRTAWVRNLWSFSLGTFTRIGFKEQLSSTLSSSFWYWPMVLLREMVIVSLGDIGSKRPSDDKWMTTADGLTAFWKATSIQ